MQLLFVDYLKGKREGERARETEKRIVGWKKEKVLFICWYSPLSDIGDYKSHLNKSWLFFIFVLTIGLLSIIDNQHDNSHLNKLLTYFFCS